MTGRRYQFAFWPGCRRRDSCGLFHRMVRTRVQDRPAPSSRNPARTRWECPCGKKSYISRDCSRARSHALVCSMVSLSQGADALKDSAEDSDSEDSHPSQPSLSQSQEIFAEQLAVMNGDYCGHCKAELYDSDEVFECNFQEKRRRNTYVCEHVLHKQCVLDHYSAMYSTRELQSDQPEDWSCPSCTGCVYTKVRYKKNDKVFYFQHCESPFLQSSATRNNNMQCFYCHLQI